MRTLSYECGKDLKAKIFDMDEKACKQILFGMVEFLNRNPSILKNVFIEMILDGSEYHKARIKNKV